MTEAEIHSVVIHDEPAEGATCFSTHVQVFIGATSEPGADSFDLTLASPDWVAGHADELFAGHVLDSGDVAPLTGLWLMDRWSRTAFDAALARLVAAYSPGPDFGTIAERIGRVIPWEYAYRRDAALDEAAGLPPNPHHFW